MHLLRLLVVLGALYAHWSPPGTFSAVPEALGHVAMFAALAAAAWGLAPAGAARGATVLAGGFLVAVLLEDSQPGFGRSQDPADLMADLAGLVLGVAALSAWRPAGGQ